MSDNSKKEYDMYDFIGEGKSIYDILGRYLPMMENDFSTANLVNKLPKMPCESSLYQEAYESIFAEIANALYASTQSFDGMESNIIRRKLSVEEEQKMFEEFKSIDSRSGSPRHLNSFEAYINYAKSNIREPETEELREYIVKKVTEILSDEYIATLRANKFRSVYLPNAKKFLSNPENPTEITPEKEELQFISQLLSRRDKVWEYDQFINGYLRTVEEFKHNEAISRSTEAKRARFVKDAIREAFTPEEIMRDEQGGLTSAVFGNNPMMKVEDGSFSWEVKKYKAPEVLCDVVTSYSKNGEENQRVVAISYGKFAYGTMFREDSTPTMSSDLTEVVGVTRLGKDGVHTYFVLMPFDNFDLKHIDEIKEGEKPKKIYLNGKPSPLWDSKTNRRIHLVQRDKIPEDLAEFFANIAFSDEFLSAAIDYNYSYAGTVSAKSGVPKIQASYLRNSTDVDAARYASEHSGTVAGITYATINSFLKSTDLNAQHLRLVQRVLEEKEKILQEQGESSLNASGLDNSDGNNPEQEDRWIGE